MKIVIPKNLRNPNACSIACPKWYEGRATGICFPTCAVKSPFTDYVPGPNCPGAGVYELIPDGEYAEVLQANAMAQAGLRGAVRMIETLQSVTSDRDTRSDFDRLRAIIDLALRDLAGMVEPVMLDKMIDLTGATPCET